MEERLEMLRKLSTDERLARLERRDLEMFRYVRLGVRGIYLAVGSLVVIIAQNAGLDLAAVIPLLVP